MQEVMRLAAFGRQDMQLELGLRTAAGAAHGVTRRGFGGLCLGTASALVLPMASEAAVVVPADRRFSIHRKGSPIGHHTVRFAETADGIAVTTEIELEVKIAFITAFHFRQSAAERWVDGRLVESRIETDDNGKTSSTRITADGDTLTIEGGRSNRVTTFWNTDIVRQQALIDTQRAEVTGVDAEAKGRERVEIDGGSVEAERFLIVADTGRHGEVWFDTAGNWVKGVITTRGETLAYRLMA